MAQHRYAIHLYSETLGRIYTIGVVEETADAARNAVARRINPTHDTYEGTSDLGPVEPEPAPARPNHEPTAKPDLDDYSGFAR